MPALGRVSLETTLDYRLPTTDYRLTYRQSFSFSFSSVAASGGTGVSGRIGGIFR